MQSNRKWVERNMGSLQKRIGLDSYIRSKRWQEYKSSALCIKMKKCFKKWSWNLTETTSQQTHIQKFPTSTDNQTDLRIHCARLMHKMSSYMNWQVRYKNGWMDTLTINGKNIWISVKMEWIKIMASYYTPVSQPNVNNIIISIVVDPISDKFII